MWFLSWGPRDLKLSAGALHTASFVPPPSLTPTSSAVVAGPASSPFGFHPSVPVRLHPWPCPVPNHRWSCPASHLCCSDSAFIAHHVLLSHLLPYTSAGLMLAWRWSLLPTRGPPITAVSQSAVDGASKQTELLSLMVSLSSTTQTAPYTAWNLNYRWLTFQHLSSVPEAHTQMDEIARWRACTHFSRQYCHQTAMMLRCWHLF